MLWQVLLVDLIIENLFHFRNDLAAPFCVKPVTKANETRTGSRVGKNGFNHIKGKQKWKLNQINFSWKTAIFIDINLFFL